MVTFMKGLVNEMEKRRSEGTVNEVMLHEKKMKLQEALIAFENLHDEVARKKEQTEPESDLDDYMDELIKVKKLLVEEKEIRDKLNTVPDFIELAAEFMYIHGHLRGHCEKLSMLAKEALFSQVHSGIQNIVQRELEVNYDESDELPAEVIRFALPHLKRYIESDRRGTPPDIWEDNDGDEELAKAAWDRILWDMYYGLCCYVVNDEAKVLERTMDSDAYDSLVERAMDLFKEHFFDFCDWSWFVGKEE